MPTSDMLNGFTVTVTMIEAGKEAFFGVVIDPSNAGKEELHAAFEHCFIAMIKEAPWRKNGLEAW